MDTGNTSVSQPTNGVPNGMPTTGAPGDAGADDLTTRLDSLLNQRINPKIEEMASGFRSVIDRRIGNVERYAQAVPQLQGQLSQLQQDIGRLSSYFQQAQEADLDPDEKEKRNFQRALEVERQQREQATRVANMYAAQNRVIQACQGMGIKFGDERVDWAWDQFERDPYHWAMTAVANASQVHDQELRDQMQQAQNATVNVARQRENVQAQRDQTMQQNMQRLDMAQRLDTTQPRGGQPHWLERYKQMSTQERRDFINRTLRGISKGEIKTADQL